MPRPRWAHRASRRSGACLCAGTKADCEAAVGPLPLVEQPRLGSRPSLSSAQTVLGDDQPCRCNAPLQAGFDATIYHLAREKGGFCKLPSAAVSHLFAKSYIHMPPDVCGTFDCEASGG